MIFLTTQESMATNISQRDEALRRKEDKIKELNFNITVLNQDAKLKAQRVEEVAAERDAHWANEIAALQMRLHESERKSSRADAEKSGSALSSVLKTENDSLKARLMALEERLHRQEHERKRTVLKERSSNVQQLHYDAADIAAKPTRSAAQVETRDFVIHSDHGV